MINLQFNSALVSKKSNSLLKNLKKKNLDCIKGLLYKYACFFKMYEMNLYSSVE